MHVSATPWAQARSAPRSGRVQYTLKVQSAMAVLFCSCRLHLCVAVTKLCHEVAFILSAERLPDYLHEHVCTHWATWGLQVRHCSLPASEKMTCNYYYTVYLPQPIFYQDYLLIWLEKVRDHLDQFIVVQSRLEWKGYLIIFQYQILSASHWVSLGTPWILISELHRSTSYNWRQHIMIHHAFNFIIGRRREIMSKCVDCNSEFVDKARCMIQPGTAMLPLSSIGMLRLYCASLCGFSGFVPNGRLAPKAPTPRGAWISAKMDPGPLNRSSLLGITLYKFYLSFCTEQICSECSIASYSGRLLIALAVRTLLLSWDASA